MVGFTFTACDDDDANCRPTIEASAYNGRICHTLLRLNTMKRNNRLLAERPKSSLNSRGVHKWHVSVSGKMIGVCRIESPGREWMTTLCWEPWPWLCKCPPWCWRRKRKSRGAINPLSSPSSFFFFLPRGEILNLWQHTHIDSGQENFSFLKMKFFFLNLLTWVCQRV